MKRNHDGIITIDSELLLPHFNEVGRLCSLIYENREIYLVEKEPLQIIKDSIAYYGSSLDGSLYGAKTALGNIQLPPVQICAKQGMYWFSTQRFTNKTNIWLSYSHIRELKTVDDKSVEIITMSDMSVIIQVAKPRMYKRMTEAHCYSKIIESRTTQIRRLEKNESRIFYDVNRKHYEYEMKV